MSTPFDQMVPAHVAGIEAATDNQVRFIADLFARRCWSESPQLRCVDRAAELATIINVLGDRANGVRINHRLYECASSPLTKAGASKLIDWLKDQPVKVAVAQPTAASDLPREDVVPAGRYAVATDDGAVNELAFYKVDRPTEGRWAGYVFVKHLVGGDEQRMSFAASKAVLQKIAQAGAEQASIRYGHEIGECGICGRRLTNDDSRERGIGPVCAANMGW